MPAPFPPLYLAGQTGSGKTSVALELVRHFPRVEIVNADAFQVYRGMEIVSAAPSEAERALCPHHLFGTLDPAMECDAATFASMARARIAEIAARAVPLIVGGSGLYLKAITHGLAPTPKGDPELRRKLDTLPLDELIREYQRLDAEGAAKTNLKNRRYVTRNLEISILSGRPASVIKSEWKINHPDIKAFYIHRTREDIYARINRRTLAMFEAGVLDEVSRLGPLSPTAEKAIGLREIQAHLRGEMDRETCITTIQQTTRHYAKRQGSWFKRETAFHRLETGIDESPETTAARIIESYTLPPGNDEKTRLP